jgi:hypothetical protein
MRVDQYTKLLLHCNGADAATVFFDEALHTVTQNGGAQIDTAQYKFNGASGLFDGTGDYLSLADSDDWDFGTGNFTVETWLRRNGNQADYAGIISAGGPAAGPTGWAISFGNAAGGTTNKVIFYSNTTGSWTSNITASAAISDTTWTHVAVVRNGTALTLYYDGVSKGTYDCTGKTFNSSNSGVVIGRLYTGIDNYYFKGHLDEIRISKGIARWTAAFTPPIREYRTSGLFTFHG